MYPVVAFFRFPVLLVGLLAAAIPVLIHMIQRVRAQRVPFPDLRFLKVSMRKTSRRRKIQNILLMLVRSLVLALLAVALAQPFVAGAAGVSSRLADVALIVDNSFSMSQKGREGAILERAKGYATSVISQLRPDSRCLYLPTNGPVKVKPEFLRDLDAVQIELGQLDAYGGTSDVAAKLAYALEQAKTLGNDACQVYVIGDLQKVSWSSLNALEILHRPTKIPIVLIDCAEPLSRNLAVAQCQIVTQRLLVGEEIIIQVSVANSAAAYETDVPVSLYVDGEKRAERLIEVEEHGTHTLSFSFEVSSEGLHTGYVEIADDDIALDNRFYFAFRIENEIPVLVLKEQYSPVDILDESFFLLKVFDSYGRLNRKSPILYEEKLVGELPAVQLDAYRAVFLLNPYGLSAEDSKRLKEYVRNGGNVVVFVGEGTSVSQLNLTLGDPDESRSLLPGTLGTIAQQRGAEAGYWFVSDYDGTHPMLAPFAGRPLSLMQSIHVYKYVTVDASETASSRVLASYDSGDPFMMEKSVGQGRVLFFTTSADSQWTNFPTQRPYLPLVLEATYYLAKSAAERNMEIRSGEPVVLPFPTHYESTKVSITTPAAGGLPISATSAADGREVQKVVFTGTHPCGVYHWRVQDRPDEQGAFVVNHDPLESDLERIDEEALEKRLGSISLFIVTNDEAFNKAAVRMSKGVSFIDFFVLLLVILAVAELFLSNFMKPRKGTQPEQESAYVRAIR